MGFLNLFMRFEALWTSNTRHVFVQNKTKGLKKQLKMADECSHHSHCLSHEADKVPSTSETVLHDSDSDLNTFRKKRIKQIGRFRDKRLSTTSASFCKSLVPFRRRFNYSSTFNTLFFISVLYLSTLILSVSSSILGSLDYESKIIFLFLF